MSTLITDDVYEAVLAERVCAERSKDAASTLMGVPKTESGRYGERFMRPRRFWKHVAHGQSPGRSSTACGLARGPDVYNP